MAMANGLLRSGRDRMGCFENSSFSESKAFWQEEVHFHSRFFLVRSMSGWAMLE